MSRQSLAGRFLRWTGRQLQRWWRAEQAARRRHQAAQQPALATRRGRRTRPRPVTPPAKQPRPARPAVPPAAPPPRSLIDELLSAPPGSEQEAAIWERYLDRYRAKQTIARPRAKPVAVEAHTRGGAKVSGHRRAAPGGGLPRDPAKLQAGLAVLAALVQEVERAQRAQQQEGA